MLKRFLWSFAKPLLREWLLSRALVLPAKIRGDIARKFGVPGEAIELLEAHLRDTAITEFDRFQP